MSRGDAYRAVSHIGRGKNVRMTGELRQQGGFQRGAGEHIHDVNLDQRRFAGVKTAFENRVLGDFVLLDSQCFGNQQGQRIGGVVEREFEFSKSDHVRVACVDQAEEHYDTRWLWCVSGWRARWTADVLMMFV